MEIFILVVAVLAIAGYWQAAKLVRQQTRAAAAAAVTPTANDDLHNVDDQSVRTPTGTVQSGKRTAFHKTTMKTLMNFTILSICFISSEAFVPLHRPGQVGVAPASVLHLSDWSSFQAIDDDDDDLLDMKIDKREYAVEDDPDEIKAQVGATLDAPEISDPPTEAIMVPAGSQLELSEDTVLGVLQAAREELGTLFGYSAENRGVGITVSSCWVSPT
jgi:hypothetical protein